MKSIVAACIGLGCATTQKPEPTQTNASAVPAHDDSNYQAAVAMQWRRNWGAAIVLFRQAAVDLPPEPAFDQQRHDILMRIASVQVEAYRYTGDLGFLFDAQTMLQRYAELPESQVSSRREELVATYSELETFLLAERRRGVGYWSSPEERYPETRSLLAALERRKQVNPPWPAGPTFSTEPEPMGPPPVGLYGMEIFQTVSGSDYFRAALMLPR